MGRLALCLTALTALAACAPPPPALIGSTAPEVTSAPYPALAPIDALLAAAPAAPAADPAAATAGRAAALRARAARLRAIQPSS